MPVARLTATNVGTLPAIGGRRTDYVDSLCPGFVLRVSPSGRRAYGVAAWSDGKKRRVLIGRVDNLELGKARDRAREILEALAARRPPPPAERGTLTVAKLVNDSLKDARLRPKTLRECKRLAKVEIGPRIGTRAAAEIRRRDVRELAAAIASPSIARQTIALLSRSYSWALDRDLLDVNPCLRMLPPPPAANDRVLSTEELWALLRAIARGRRRFPLYADATELLLLTVVRRGGVLGMTRAELEDLDGQAPRWVIPARRMKGKRVHVVPLSPAALEIVRRRMRATKTQHLFPWSKVFPAQGLERRRDAPAGWDGKWRLWLRRRVARALRARQRASGRAPTPVPRWTIHNLRHTAATHMREDLEVASDVVSLLLAHDVGGPAVSRVYDRASKLRERRAALEAWAAWLARLRG